MPELYCIQDFLKSEDKAKWLYEAFEEELKNNGECQVSEFQVGRVAIKIVISSDHHSESPNDWGNNRILFRGHRYRHAYEAEEALGLTKDGHIPDSELEDCEMERAMNTALFQALRNVDEVWENTLEQLLTDLRGNYSLAPIWDSWADGDETYKQTVDLLSMHLELPMPDLTDEDACADFIRDSLRSWYEKFRNEREDKALWWKKKEAGEYGVKYAETMDVTEHGRTVIHPFGRVTHRCPWDTSRAGAVWVPNESTIKELDAIADPVERRKRQEAIADADIDVYQMWMDGDVWVHSLVATELTAIENGKPVDEIYDDSCGGHYGGGWKEYVKDALQQLAQLIVEAESTDRPYSHDVIQVLREKDGVRTIRLEKLPHDGTDDIEYGRFLCSAELGTKINI